MTPTLVDRAKTLLGKLEGQHLKIATAESCTGGLLSALLTEIPGSSAVFERGFVTYSNPSKHELLGVPEELLETLGSVSGPVAQAMAEGALARSGARIAVAITGVAGPGGGTAAKPVGLVHFALARSGEPTRLVERRFDARERHLIRLMSVEQALALLEEAAEIRL